MLSSLFLLGGTFATTSMSANAKVSVQIDSQDIFDDALMGTTWTKIDGGLSHISVGDYGVWGINANDEIYFRTGCSKLNPIGTGWTKIDGGLKDISVGDYGVWGTNANDEIYFRNSVSNLNPIGTGWTKVDGGLKDVSVGKYGVWGTNANDEIFVRDNIK